MQWLALYFPALPLEVQANAAVPAQAAKRQESSDAQSLAQAPQTESTRQPQVLIASGRVALRNPRAAAAGIEPGTTLATACAIAPALQHFHDNPALTARRLRQLAEVLYQFSSQVVMTPPQALLLEVQGSLKLFGELEELINRIVATCQALGHDVRAQVAGTPLAALALAQSGANSLEAVPLQHIPAEPAVRERLANMGIYRLAGLLVLPEAELGQRFGPELLDYLQRLTGRKPDPRSGIAPARNFHSCIHLLEAIREKDTLLFPMQRLLLELEHWLIGRQLGALRLCWVFAAQRRKVRMTVAFSTPTQRNNALLDISRLQLAGQALQEEVLDVHLHVRDLRPWAAGSTALFNPRTMAGGQADIGDRDELGTLIDQLRARLGQDVCHGIQPLDQHCPEQAWQKITPGMHRLRVGRSPPGAHTERHHDRPRGRRPLWLFDIPRAVAADELRLIYGPERIQTRWWEGAITRDYYIAEHRGGARCWAFVDTGNQWYLHGYFG